MFEHLILVCLDRLGGERTVSGIYHLLTGKRSSQTMQDAKGYELDDYFGIYPSLEREPLERMIHSLEKRNLIRLNEKSFPFLTDQGVDHLYTFPDQELHFFKGMVWHEVIPVFVRRMTLLIQMITNHQSGIYHYVPIVEDFQTQKWARAVYVQFQNKIPKIIESLYTEIQALMCSHNRKEADIFVHRLTGGSVIGMTLDQLAREFDEEPENIHLLLQHTAYYLFLEAKKDNVRFPVLHLCTKGLDASHLITRSARKTYHYLQQGLGLQEIIRVRRLKKSTIQDHIVESALIIPDFPIDPFLEREDVEAINHVAARLDTKKLKQIHEALHGKYDYFELRLALAKGQHRTKEGFTQDEV